MWGTKPARPDLIFLLGLDFLGSEKKQCPHHLKECYSFITKMLKTFDMPVVIVHMPQQRDKRPLKQILQSTVGPLPKNLLILEQGSIDEVLV